MPTPRMSAEARHAQILDVAMPLIAAGGFEATSTLAIAQAAGISHAYLFRLFPSKQDLSAALVVRCNQTIHRAFRHAADRAFAQGEDVMTALAGAYTALLDDRDTILVQLHAHAASPQHPEIRDAMRTAFRDLHALVSDVTGAPEEQITAFFATGMLLNVAAALDLRDVDEPWARALAVCGPGQEPNPAHWGGATGNPPTA